MYNNQLTAFVHVADCGSFNKAAEKLLISSTAIMKQINALELHLGLKLLERTNQGIRLTAAGKSIYKDSKYLFEYSKKAICEAKKMMDIVGKTICVGTSMLNPCKPFMDLWSQINDDFSGHKLHIVPFKDDHKGILSEISALGEKYDFLVGVCDSNLWLKRCNFLKLGEYRRSFAVPMTHRLASKKELSFSDLHGETLIMVRRGDSPINDGERDEIEREHLEIRIDDTDHFYDIEVFNRCVKTGSILSSIECWKDIHPALVTIPMALDATIPYGLLYSLNPTKDILEIVEAVKKTIE